MFNQKKIMRQIEAVRKEKKISKKDFCGLVSISKPTYNSYLNGRTHISLTVVNKMTKILAIDLKKMVNEEGLE